MDLLSEFGPNLREPHSKRISSNLYELRIKSEKSIRILYTIKGREVVFLHAFVKSSQKLPKKELKIALDRLTKVI